MNRRNRKWFSLFFFCGKLLIALQLFPGGWTVEMKKEEEEDRSGLTGTEWEWWANQKKKFPKFVPSFWALSFLVACTHDRNLGIVLVLGKKMKMEWRNDWNNSKIGYQWLSSTSYQEIINCLYSHSPKYKKIETVSFFWQRCFLHIFFPANSSAYMGHRYGKLGSQGG